MKMSKNKQTAHNGLTTGKHISERSMRKWAIIRGDNV